MALQHMCVHVYVCVCCGGACRPPQDHHQDEAALKPSLDKLSGGVNTLQALIK